MADLPYCQPADLVLLAGQLAIDLRSDDGDAAAFEARAIDYASGQIDFYCQGRFRNTDLAASRVVRDWATTIALEWYCLHRLNEVPKSLKAMSDQYYVQLGLVLAGKASVPGCARPRRPITVTTPKVDLRRSNNQVRTDKPRSTGVVQGYVEPTDPTAPDQR